MAYTPASTRKKSGKEYRYYRCITRDQQGAKACPAKPLPADAIEDFVVQRIRKAATDNNLAEGITDELKAMVKERRKSLETEHRGLPAEIARLSVEGRNLVETLGTAKGTAHRLLEERIEEVGEQINRGELRLHAVERSLIELTRVEVEATWVADALMHFDEVWNVLTVENQARLVEAVIKEVVVDDVKGTVSAEVVDLSRGAMNACIDEPAFISSASKNLAQATMEAST